ncbi:MAG: OsmC family protein [Aggregatilineales bacterium]
MATVVVRSEQGYRTAIHTRNHVIFADEPIHDGGTDTAPTPMEMLLGSLGSCIVITTQMFALRKNWPLEGVSVELEMVRIRSEDYPSYTGDAAFVHEIRSQIHFEGPLTEEQRARLMTVSGKCPVHLTLANPVFFVEKLVEQLSEG